MLWAYKSSKNCRYENHQRSPRGSWLATPRQLHPPRPDSPTILIGRLAQPRTPICSYVHIKVESLQLLAPTLKKIKDIIIYARKTDRNTSDNNKLFFWKTTFVLCKRTLNVYSFVMSVLVYLNLHISLRPFRVDFLGLSDRKQLLFSSRRQENTWGKKTKNGFITLIPFPMFSTTVEHKCFTFPQTASHVSEWFLRRCCSSERALGTCDPSVLSSSQKPWKNKEHLKQMGLFPTDFLCAICIYICQLYLFVCHGQ